MKQTLILGNEGADLEINIVVEQIFSVYEANVDWEKPGNRFRDNVVG